MKIANKCLACGSRDFNFERGAYAPWMAGRMLGYRPDERPVELPTTICDCRVCGLRFARMRPGDEEMKRLYRDYRGEAYNRDRICWEPSYAAIADKVGNPELEWRGRMKALRELLKGIPKEKKIAQVLDYGGGSGAFIPPMPDGVRKWVYDPGVKETVLGAELLGNLSDYEPADLVLCQHVLEHLPNPRAALEEIVGVTNQGAYLALVVPDEIVQSRHSTEVNEHLTWFTMVSLGALIEKVGGLEIVTMCSESVDYRWTYGRELLVLVQRVK